MDYKVTKKQFKLFKECFCDMTEALGLKEYRVHFEFQPVEGGYGSCSADVDGKIAIIELNTVFKGWEATDDHVKQVAQHECLELLMWEMYELSRTRFTSNERIEAARHSVIRRLEKLI
jgi:hypothetical protein